MNDSVVPPGVARIGIGEIRSPRIRRLHDYWDMQRARRRASDSSCPAASCIAPRRVDILPHDIRDLLAHLMIVDVERHAPVQSPGGDILRFRYRLVGTQVVAYNGVEFTGKYLGEIGWQGEADLERSYRELVEARSPVFGAFSWELHGGGDGHCEFGRFPLSEDGAVVTQVLAIEDYNFAPHDATPAR